MDSAGKAAGTAEARHGALSVYFEAAFGTRRQPESQQRGAEPYWQKGHAAMPFRVQQTSEPSTGTNREEKEEGDECENAHARHPMSPPGENSVTLRHACAPAVSGEQSEALTRG